MTVKMEKLLQEKREELYCLEYSGRDHNAIHLGRKAILKREIRELEEKQGEGK